MNMSMLETRTEPISRELEIMKERLLLLNISPIEKAIEKKTNDDIMTRPVILGKSIRSVWAPKSQKEKTRERTIINP